MVSFFKKSANVEPAISVGDRTAGAEAELDSAGVAAAQQQEQETFRVEQEWAHRVYDKLIKAIDLGRINSMEEGGARREIREIAQRIMNDESVPLNAPARQRVVRQVENEVLGFGPLEMLFEDSTVSDILVNGHKSVFVERKGRLERTHISFRDDAHLLNIIDRIVTKVGRRIDESSPMVDARLPDGSRVNAIIPPLALDGPALSIRRFAVDRLKAEDLVSIGSVPAPVVEVLQAVVKARLNVLISGGTGTGKTTMLNVLSAFIPSTERIVTIEDSAELQLQQPHVVRLETRPPNIEGRGEVTQRDLVRNSLRMRPDRIVLGEVRAGEALDMLQAMNTGHDGSLATVHANTPRDALSRIETMISMAGFSLPVRAMRSQIASAINVVLQLERMEDGRRRVVSVQEIQGMEGDVIVMTEFFRFQRRGIDNTGGVVGEFVATGIVPKFCDILKHRGLALDLGIFRQGPIER